MTAVQPRRRKPGAPGRASIRDVAERAGVSVTTVSHALNGTRFVSEEARAKVEAEDTMRAGLEAGEPLAALFARHGIL